jgi:hypothetical protein
MKLIFLTELKKNSDIEIYENPFFGSQVVPHEQQTHKTKLIVAFHNFAKAPIL